MALEIDSDRAVCFKCGRKYTKRKTYYRVSYADCHKGVGFFPVCNSCTDSIFRNYLKDSGDVKTALRQFCLKFDLYWSEKIYESIESRSVERSVITQYMSAINKSNYAGKNYDDTLREEGIFLNFGGSKDSKLDKADVPEEPLDDGIEPVLPEEWVAFWGTGYSYSMYKDLEQRRQYYLSKLPNGYELDIGSESLIRQICNLEVGIAKDSAAGKSIEKSVTALNTLLGSLNLKPNQRKNDDAEGDLSSTPMGVWLYRYEYKRPLPEVNTDNKYKKYIFTWFGHLVKMLGIKNGYTRMYEEEIERLRVERPEYDDEDDESFLMNVFNEEVADE